MRRRGAVLKHVAQVRAAFLAHHLGSLHAESAVGFGLHVFLGDRRPETRPAGARFELGVRAEQRIGTAHAKVSPLLVILIILACEGALGALFAGYRVLLRSQLLLPLLVLPDDFVI